MAVKTEAGAKPRCFWSECGGEAFRVIQVGMRQRQTCGAHTDFARALLTNLGVGFADFIPADWAGETHVVPGEGGGALKTEAGAKPRMTYQANCHQRAALKSGAFSKRTCRWKGPVRPTEEEARADFAAHSHPWGGGWSISIREA